MLTLVVISLAVSNCFGLLKVGITEYFSEQAPHFVNFTADGECEGAFECDIANQVCAGLNETCVTVALPDLDSRFSALEKGDVDFTISQSSVSPERAERVHFVRPYYYYAGVQIYVLESMPVDEHPSWEDVSGLTLCTLEDYYATDAVELRYGATMLEIGTLADYVLQGLCDACVTDSTEIIPGMVPSTNSLIEFGAPYGIATSHEDRETLGAAISSVMVDMMTNGTDSLILQFEEMHLFPLGFPKNKKLADIVTAHTDMGGAIPAIEEDAIWDE